MSDWQPIETAPVDERVELGWWDDDPGGGLKWSSCTGVAWRWLDRGLWGRRKARGYPSMATHWRHLPSPPEVTP